jgi:hypothetical protein
MHTRKRRPTGAVSHRSILAALTLAGFIAGGIGVSHDGLGAILLAWLGLALLVTALMAYIRD